MTPSARIQAAIEILDAISTGSAAEPALLRWARNSRYAGSGDRAAVRDHVFDVLRRKDSCAVLGGGMDGRALMLGLLRSQGSDADQVFSGARFAPSPLSAAELALMKAPIPEDLPLDVPDWLMPDLERSLGDHLPAVAEALKSRASVHLRVNGLKANLAKAQTALADDGIETRPHPAAETALEVSAGQRRVRQSTAYLQGLVELQDAASQAVVESLPLQPDMRVLDYCAGGGGKALAMAARGDLAIEAHDIDPARMADLPMRAERAGAQVRCVESNALSGAYDLVLCDAPCSGSGAWRRSPDGKWRLTEDRLQALTVLQDDILDTASRHMSPDGVLAYVTCSLLTCENRDRVDAFLARNPDWHRTDERVWLPDGGADGFYIAHLAR